MRRKTPADYHALAEERSFRWLGPKAPNTEAKTGWDRCVLNETILDRQVLRANNRSYQK